MGIIVTGISNSHSNSNRNGHSNYCDSDSGSIFVAIILKIG